MEPRTLEQAKTTREFYFNLYISETTKGKLRIYNFDY